MATAMEKLKILSAKRYDEQAKFFLNAYWSEKFADDADKREKVWKETQGIIKIDPKGKKNNELAEIKAHLFIEKFGGAATWVKFRDVMRKIDKDFNNKMSLTEYFIFHYEVDWKELVKREQVYGKEAQEALNKANEALEQANEAMLASQKASAEAKEAQKAAEEALAAQKAAEEEVRAGLALIEKEEAKKAAKIAKYKSICEDPTAGTVKRGKAFQQMKQAEGEDPLPLRKAKLEQQAKVRKAKKASKLAAKRAKKATAAAEKAEAAAKQAEVAFEAASETVQKLASSLGGAGEGTLWWMDRELEEAAQFLPKSKQRALRKKMAAAKKALLSGEAAPVSKKKKKKRGKKASAASAFGAAKFGATLKSRVKKRKKKKAVAAASAAEVHQDINDKDYQLNKVSADSGASELVARAKTQLAITKKDQNLKKTKAGLSDSAARAKTQMALTNPDQKLKKTKAGLSDSAARAKTQMALTNPDQKLKKTKAGLSDAAARAKTQMALTNPDQKLKHVEAPDTAPSDAVKAAFVEDQKEAVAESSSEEDDE